MARKREDDALTLLHLHKGRLDDLERRVTRLECSHPKESRTFDEQEFSVKYSSSPSKIMPCVVETCSDCGKTLKVYPGVPMARIKAIHYQELADEYSKEEG